VEIDDCKIMRDLYRELDGDHADIGKKALQVGDGDDNDNDNDDDDDYVYDDDDDISRG
jgi:hypothetical protein